MKPGPKPKCHCGECHPCRARRRRYGEVLDNRVMSPLALIKPRGFSQPAYVAGLIDGEGCITKNNNCWRVQIAMTDEDVIRWLGQFGGTVRERSVRGNRKPCWRWLVMRQRDVLCLLDCVLPYLRVKKQQAVSAMEEIRSRVGSDSTIERRA